MLQFILQSLLQTWGRNLFLRTQRSPSLESSTARNAPKQASGEGLPPHVETGFQPVAEDLSRRRMKMEKEMLHSSLAAARGNVSAAARTLGISRQLLNYKMKKYALNRNDYAASDA